MTDIPLNELGKTQATYAKEALRDVHINAAYASPLQRAVETAQIILESHETDLIIENELAERSEERRVGKEGRSRWSPYH